MIVWACKCDCGGETRLTTGALQPDGSGRGIVSCGCRWHEVVAPRHGHGRAGKRTPEYIAWHNMVSRCRKEDHPSYPEYGGRGIDVCDLWLDFEPFFENVGPRPSKAHSLDRIDNNRGYAPGNVRWALGSEQHNNKRSNRYLTHNGRTLTMKQWAETTGIKYKTIEQRLNKYGWPIERALEK